MSFVDNRFVGREKGADSKSLEDIFLRILYFELNTIVKRKVKNTLNLLLAGDIRFSVNLLTADQIILLGIESCCCCCRQHKTSSDKNSRQVSFVVRLSKEPEREFSGRR